MVDRSWVNTASLNMKNFAEDPWTSKGFLDVQRMEDLFIFRVQSEVSMQNMLDLFFMPFENMVSFFFHLEFQVNQYNT